MLQISHGEEFLSETDTEVIPKLCKYVYRGLTERVSLSQVRQPSPPSSLSVHSGAGCPV